MLRPTRVIGAIILAAVLGACGSGAPMSSAPDPAPTTDRTPTKAGAGSGDGLTAPIVIAASYLGEGTSRWNTADGRPSSGDEDAKRYTSLRLGIHDVLSNRLDLSPSSMDYVLAHDTGAESGGTTLQLTPGQKYVLFTRPGRGPQRKTNPYVQVVEQALELDDQQQVHYPDGSVQPYGELMRGLINAEIEQRPTQQAVALSATADARATLKESTPRAPEPTFAVEGVADDPDVRRLIAGLHERGVHPRLKGRSMVAWLGTAPGQAYRIGDGDSSLYVHLYPTVEAAKSAASEIPATADNGMTDWVDEPHFYRCDRLIGLYLGRSSKVSRALEDVCGPAFAEADRGR